MWRNLVVAFSNFPAIYPIALAYGQGDYLTCGALFFVAFFSFASHLAENHKHGMEGIGWSQTTSYILNRFDVLGSLATGGRLVYLYYAKYGISPAVFSSPWLCAGLVGSLVLSAISEYDKYNKTLRTRYMVTHCAWHMSIFSLMGIFLKKIIY